MKRVSAVTLFNTAEGLRMSVAYSDFDENGKVIKSNTRVDRLIMDSNDIETANSIISSAQGFIDTMEE